MMRAVAGGGTLQNGGLNLHPNRPSCGDTGVGVGGLVGEYYESGNDGVDGGGRR